MQIQKPEGTPSDNGQTKREVKIPIGSSLEAPLPSNSTKEEGSEHTQSPFIKLSDKEFAYDIWLFSYGGNNISIKSLYLQGILALLERMGYRKRIKENNTYFFIQEKNNILRQIEPFQMKDELLDYVRKQKEALKFDYYGSKVETPAEKLLEIFLKQSQPIFKRDFLEQLPTHSKPILKDTKDCAYLFFANTVFKIVPGNYEECGYSELDNCCVWESHINRHQFIFRNDFKRGHYYKFIMNIANRDENRFNSIVSAIGYLVHNFSHPSKGQAVVCYDEQITGKQNPQGGTGKGIFAQAIGQVRDTVKIDGKKFNPADRFKFQDVTDRTQVVWLDDPNPALDFNTFHSCLTDGWSVEKKHKDQIFIKPEDSPKLLINSNHIVKGEGSTNRRRQFVLEFSNHYQKKIQTGVEEPIREEHGCTFFDDEDWDQEEWARFFSFMAYCVSDYLQLGLQPYQSQSLDQNKIIQYCGEEFGEWVVQQGFELNKDYKTEDYFMSFKKGYYGESEVLKQRSFSNKLNYYAAINNWQYISKNRNNTRFFRFIS